MNMMYPYMTLNDDTEITHSGMYPNGKEKYILKHQMTPAGSIMLLAGFQNTNGKI